MLAFALGEDVLVRLLAAVGVLLAAVAFVLIYEAIRASFARSAATADLGRLLPGMTREEVTSLLGRPSRDPAPELMVYDYGWGVVLEVSLDEQKQVSGVAVKSS